MEIILFLRRAVVIKLHRARSISVRVILTLPRGRALFTAPMNSERMTMRRRRMAVDTEKRHKRRGSEHGIIKSAPS